MNCVDCGQPTHPWYGDVTSPRCFDDWLITYYGLSPAALAEVDRQIAVYRGLGEPEEKLAARRRKKLTDLAAAIVRHLPTEPDDSWDPRLAAIAQARHEEQP